MRVALPAVIVLFAIAGCARNQAPSAQAASGTDATSATAAAASAAPAATGVPVPRQEPSEEVLRKLEFKRYGQIDQAGGVQVTVTATGQSTTLHPTLHEVHKDKCSPTPQATPGWYECGLTIKLSLAADGSDPSEQGERIGVKWDPKGEWVEQ